MEFLAMTFLFGTTWGDGSKYAHSLYEKLGTSDQNT